MSKPNSTVCGYIDKWCESAKSTVWKVNDIVDVQIDSNNWKEAVIKEITNAEIVVEMLYDKRQKSFTEFESKCNIEHHGLHTFYIDKLEKIKTKVLKYEAFPKGFTGLMNLGNT